MRNEGKEGKGRKAEGGGGNHDKHVEAKSINLNSPSGWNFLQLFNDST